MWKERGHELHPLPLSAATEVQFLNLIHRFVSFSVLRSWENHLTSLTSPVTHP